MPEPSIIKDWNVVIQTVDGEQDSTFTTGKGGLLYGQIENFTPSAPIVLVVHRVRHEYTLVPHQIPSGMESMLAEYVTVVGHAGIKLYRLIGHKIKMEAFAGIGDTSFQVAAGAKWEMTGQVGRAAQSQLGRAQTNGMGSNLDMPYR